MKLSLSSTTCFSNGLVVSSIPLPILPPLADFFLLPRPCPHVLEPPPPHLRLLNKQFKFKSFQSLLFGKPGYDHGTMVRQNLHTQVCKMLFSLEDRQWRACCQAQDTRVGLRPKHQGWRWPSPKPQAPNQLAGLSKPDPSLEHR